MINPTTRTQCAAFFRRSVPDVVNVLVITAVSLSFTFGLEEVLDIGLRDESAYLWRGVRSEVYEFPPASKAPLYSTWYYVLSFLQPDRVELYYLNYKILNLLPSLLFYGFLRAGQANSLVALAAACLIVTCQGNLQTWPKVSHFALSILFAGLALASLFKKPSVIFGTVSLAALATSYVRPEYFVAFLLSTFACFTIALRAKRRRDYITPSAVVTTAVLVLIIHGFPMGGEGGRRFVAFQQHFSLNWVNWTSSELNPWSDSGQIIRDCFGDAHSATQCALRNPALVLKHILANTKSLPSSAADLFLCPSQRYGGNLWYSKLPNFYFLALLAFAMLTIGRFSFSRVRSVWRSTMHMTGATVILLTSPLVASLLIYPRDHHLLLLTAPALGLCLVLARDCCVKFQYAPVFCSLTVGAFFLFLMPVVFQATPVLFQASDELPVKTTVVFLKSLEPDQDVQLLDAEGGFHHYLDDKWHRIKVGAKNEPFHAFRERTHINAILLTDRLAKDSRFRSDSEWQQFISSPEAYDFTSIAIPGTKFRLLHKRYLFRMPGEVEFRKRASPATDQSTPSAD